MLSCLLWHEHTIQSFRRHGHNGVQDKPAETYGQHGPDADRSTENNGQGQEYQIDGGSGEEQIGLRQFFYEKR